MKLHTLITGISALVSLIASSAPVVPGEYTDPSNLKKALDTEESFTTPADFQFPYIATYYIKPTVTTDENVEIGYYVTDWDHSLVRMGDDSHRFDIHLHVVLPGGKTVSRVQRGVKSGDGKFRFKPLPKGEYRFCVWAVDLAKGLESHRVWQRFRVLEPADLVIPAGKIYTMTGSDLEKYNICNKGDLGRRVPVEVPECPDKTKFNDRMKLYKDTVLAYASANPPKPREGAPGYTVYVPVQGGETVYHSWRCSHIVRDAGYDTNKVERTAIANSEGLQKLLEDKAAAGFRKVVLYPGVYRLSAARTVFIPSNMTFDLNGAVLKQHEFAGAKSIMVGIGHETDAHLVNGIIEGDYYEHDYEGSTNGSEWPMGFYIKGEAMYCSVENVYVRDITGYGAGNNMGWKDGKVGGGVATFKNYTEGALDPKDGTLDTSRKDLFTSDFAPVSRKAADKIQVSKFLGYQGMLMRQWTMTGCWYDKDRKFISSETIYQYRIIPVPENAAFLRVTVFAESLKKVNDRGNSLKAIRFYVPQNCTIRNCTFDRCRCVGYAPAAMRNFLFDGNLFTRSGESAARCAFDAEDGWDGMQDVYFTNNRCKGNPINNSLLTCAGHNFIFERNDADIHFWPRTHSPCVRDNDIGSGSFMCDGRACSGYGRFTGNRYSRSLSVKGKGDGGWDYAFFGFDMTGPATNDKFKLELTKAARVVNSKFAGRKLAISKAVGCSFKDCETVRLGSGAWSGVVYEGGKMLTFTQTNVYENCSFKKVHFQGFLRGSMQTFRKCTFEDCTFMSVSGADMRFEGCTIKGGDFWNGYWCKVSDLKFKDCSFEFTGKRYFRMGSYGIGNVVIDSCTVKAPGAKDAIFFDISDWRKSRYQEDVVGRITVTDCTFGEGIVHAVGTSADAKRNYGLGKGEKPVKKIVCTMKGNKMAGGLGDLGDLPGEVR